MFFLDTDMESVRVSVSEHWQQIPLFAGGASFSGYFPMGVKSLSEMNTRSWSHADKEEGNAFPIHHAPSTGGGSLNPFSQDAETNQMGVLAPSFGL